MPKLKNLSLWCSNNSQHPPRLFDEGSASSNLCTLLVIAIVLLKIPDIFSWKVWLHTVLCRSTVPGVTSQSSCGLWLWVKLRVSDFNVCFQLLMNMWIKKRDREGQWWERGTGGFSSGSKVAGRYGPTGWKRSCWDMRGVLALSELNCTPDAVVLSPFSLRLFHGLVSVCWGWVNNGLCAAAGQRFSRWNRISPKPGNRVREGTDGVQVFARLVSSQPLCLGQGFVGLLWMRLLVVSGEFETVERQKKGWMVLCRALLGRSQTRVPGLALSRPYHCTSANSEHRGLLRKQLSLKDLQGQTTTPGWRPQTHTRLFKQTNVSWGLIPTVTEIQEHTLDQSPVHHRTHTPAQGPLRVSKQLVFGTVEVELVTVFVPYSTDWSSVWHRDCGFALTFAFWWHKYRWDW